MRSRSVCGRPFFQLSSTSSPVRILRSKAIEGSSGLRFFSSLARAPHQRLSLGAPANGLQHLHHKSELDGDGGVVRAIEALGDAKRLAKFASLETLINLLIELDELFANFNLNRCRRSW
jgi:hypothetical protein